jgi:hypothetical protein
MTSTDTKPALRDHLSWMVARVRYNILMPPERKIESENHPLEGSGLTYFRDNEDKYWLPLESAAELSELKPNTLRRLVWDDRVCYIQPGGRDLFLSYDSLVNYLNNDRKPRGRPSKNSSSQDEE